MKSIILYIKERFPAALALVCSFILMAVINLYLFSKVRFDAAFFISAALLTLFLFRVRLGDDIKDSVYDDKFHPDRPVQIGMVSRKQLAALLGAVLVLESGLQFFLFPGAVLVYAALIFYWGLMFYDFFNKKFWEKHFFFYILLHQIIFAFYVYYFMAAAKGSIFVPGRQDLAAIFFFFLCLFIYEISRKMNHRHDAMGNITDDTYIYRWGKKNVLLLLAAFILAQMAVLLFLNGFANIFFVLYALLAALGFLAFRDNNGPGYFIFLVIFGLATFSSYYLLP